MVTTVLHEDQDLITAERLIKTLLQYLTYDEVVSFLSDVGVAK